MIRRSWSGYAPVEATLEVLASALRDVKGRMRQLFAQERTAVNAGLFLDGVLSEEQRKTGWMRSEAAGTVGMPMRCGILFASMSSNICAMMTQCW